MVIDKIKFGTHLFDDLFGGVFRGRQVLCCGRQGSGKTVFAIHFLKQAIADNEKALMLSAAHPHDTVILAESMGVSLTDAIAENRLILLEYASFISESNISDDAMLPPQAFMELQRIVETESISRLVFDTVLPWVTIYPTDRIAEHVYSFTRAIYRLNATTLFTLPQPVSKAAFTLRECLENATPVSIGLELTESRKRFMTVSKYLGQEEFTSESFPFDVKRGSGIIARNQPVVSQAAAPQPETVSDFDQPPQKKSAGEPIQFSSVIKLPML